MIGLDRFVEFPYPTRAYQDEIIELIEESVQRGHLVIEASTGIGKTICALYASAKEAQRRAKIILYLVRTNSQQRQVILESRRLGLRAVTLQGRHNRCPLLRALEDFQTAGGEELASACQDRKSRTMKGEISCEYYWRLLSEDQTEIKNWIFSTVPIAEELTEASEKQGVCPYELTKQILPEAQVVTAPYIFFFDLYLRKALLSWMEKSLDEIILVVDEAHNLPEYARELGSASLSVYSIRQAKAETERFGDPEVLKGFSAADSCDLVRQALIDLAKEYVTDEDGLLPPSAFEEYVMSALSTTSARIKQLAQNLMVHGEVIKERKRTEGKIPKSFVSSLGNFLLYWFLQEGHEFVKLVTGSENPSLVCYCLDPSEVTEVVNECWSSVHMSGTLSPLDEYRNSIGLPPETRLRRFPNPFPPENRRVFISENFTTKYETINSDVSVIPQLKQELFRILLKGKRNTVVFFPSHDIMSRFLDIRSKLSRTVYVEERSMNQQDFMSKVERFRQGNAVFFAVYGGRVSEGMDFPNEELELSVLVGIPYPKPTARLKSLINFYDVKFNKGWEYVVEAPAKRKVMQAIGRLVRNEHDKGVAIILDKRARRYRDFEYRVFDERNSLEEIESFFNGKGTVVKESERYGAPDPSVSPLNL